MRNGRSTLFIFSRTFWILFGLVVGSVSGRAEWIAVSGRYGTVAGSSAYQDRLQEAARLIDAAVDEFQSRFGLRWSGRMEWFLPSEATSDRPSDWARWPWARWMRPIQPLPFPTGVAEFRRRVRWAVAQRILEDRLRIPWIASLRPSRRVPEWFLEGVAAYFAGPPPHADEVLLRGASLNNQLIPLDRLDDLERSGDPFLARAEAASAVRFLVAEHSENALAQFLQQLAKDPSQFAEQFQRTFRISLRAWGRRWLRSVKREYWPLIRDKETVDAVARALTVSGALRVTAPAWSPSGEVIAAIVQTLQHDTVWLLSAQNGRRLREALRVDRAAGRELETRGRALLWETNPDRLTLVERRDGRPYWVSLDVIERKRVHVEPLPFDAAWSPTFAEKSAWILGQRGLQVDVYRRDGPGRWTALTHDGRPKLTLAADPDNGRLLFVQETVAGLLLNALDPVTGRVETVKPADSDVTAVAPLQKGRLLFVAGWEATRDLYLLDEDGSVSRLTNLLLSLETIAVSPDGSAVAFTVDQPDRQNILYVLPLHRAERRRVQPPAQNAFAEGVAPSPSEVAHPLQIEPARGLAFFGGTARLKTPNDGVPRLTLRSRWGHPSAESRLWGFLTLSHAPHPGGGIGLARRVAGRWTLGATGGMIWEFHRAALSLEPFRRPFVRLLVRRSLGGQRWIEAGAELFRRPVAATFDEDAPLSRAQQRWHLATPFRIVQDRTVTFERLGAVSGSYWALEVEPIGAQEGRVGVRLEGRYRCYLPVGTATVLAFRTSGAWSLGPTPPRLWLGGHAMLRGVPYERARGTRRVTLGVELRLPLISELVLSWPVRWTVRSVRGVLFSEWGTVWRAGEKPIQLRQTRDGQLLVRPYWQLGWGLRWRPGGIPLRWDMAIGYNLQQTTNWTSLVRIDTDF